MKSYSLLPGFKLPHMDKSIESKGRPVTTIASTAIYMMNSEEAVILVRNEDGEGLLIPFNDNIEITDNISSYYEYSKSPIKMSLLQCTQSLVKAEDLEKFLSNINEEVNVTQTIEVLPPIILSNINSKNIKITYTGKRGEVTASDNDAMEGIYLNPFSVLKRKRFNYTDLDENDEIKEIEAESNENVDLALKYLLKYINKNTVIPQKLNQYKNSEAVTILRSALIQGKFKHPIFSDPNCHIYLILLLQERKISLNRFITGFMYVMAMKDASKDENARLKSIKLITKDEKVYDEYINLLINQLKKQEFFSKDIDSKDFMRKLIDYSQSLNGSESLLMAIPIRIKSADQKFISRIQASPIVVSSGIVLAYEIDKHTNDTGKRIVPDDDDTMDYVLVPSASFTNYLFTLANPGRQMLVLPIFGEISTQALYQDFHVYGYHPLALYSTDVKTNIKEVDDWKVSSIPVALHDQLFHAFYGTCFNSNQYNFIFKFLLPTLAVMQEESKHDATKSAVLERMFTQFNDIEVGNCNFRFIATPLEERIYPYFAFCMDVTLENYPEFKENTVSVNTVSQIFQELYFRIKDQAAESSIDVKRLYMPILNMIVGRLRKDPNYDQIKQNAQNKISNIIQELTQLSFDQDNLVIKSVLLNKLASDPLLCLVCGLMDGSSNIYYPPLYPLPEAFLTKIMNEIGEPTDQLVSQHLQDEQSLSVDQLLAKIKNLTLTQQLKYLDIAFKILQSSRPTSSSAPMFLSNFKNSSKQIDNNINCLKEVYITCIKTCDLSKMTDIPSKDVLEKIVEKSDLVNFKYGKEPYFDDKFHSELTFAIDLKFKHAQP